MSTSTTTQRARTRPRRSPAIPTDTLTPLSSSPFGAGGAGTGTTIESQSALQVSGDGRYLLAVDAGSNEISVLRIRPDASLSQVGGSPASSGGIQPVTSPRSTSST